MDTGSDDNQLTRRARGQGRRRLDTIRGLQIVNRDVSELKPNPNNPRVHSDKQVQQVMDSISTFGFINPIVATPDDLIVTGHCRWDAALRLGLETVPVIRVDHLTDAQLRAFMIADNQLTLNASWDERLLAEQLKALAEVDLEFSIEVTGFET
jgi:ParB/RepB/Spo0J family partition protein